MKIRITIEYDPDLFAYGMTEDDKERAIASERQDWLNGNVDMHDVLATDGTVKFQIVA